MYEKGLVYRKKEQSELVPGVRHRAGQRAGGRRLLLAARDTPVEQRDLVQWFLRITAYARSCSTGWTSWKAGRKKCAPCSATGSGAARERRSTSSWKNRDQGKEPGTSRRFFDSVKEQRQAPLRMTKRIRVFTTRVDTIFGATSVQLGSAASAGGGLRGADAALKAQVDEMIDQQKKAREAGDLGAIEKHGVPTGRFAINPYNGERVPIWVANYILADYGTGAIMSVPAHDERDFEFAKKYACRLPR
jgi:leucyl-tRNA synthetase